MHPHAQVLPRSPFEGVQRKVAGFAARAFRRLVERRHGQELQHGRCQEKHAHLAVGNAPVVGSGRAHGGSRCRAQT